MKRAFLSAAAAVLTMIGAAIAQTDVPDGGVGDPAKQTGGEDVEAMPADYFARDKFAVETIVCPFKGKVKYKPGEISCGLLSRP